MHSLRPEKFRDMSCLRPLKKCKILPLRLFVCVFVCLSLSLLSLSLSLSLCDIFPKCQHCEFISPCLTTCNCVTNLCSIKVIFHIKINWATRRFLIISQGPQPGSFLGRKVGASTLFLLRSQCGTFFGRNLVFFCILGRKLDTALKTSVCSSKPVHFVAIP